MRPPPALSPGHLELRRFLRSPLPRLALVALIMLPLLYAGLYLWSFWDPYGKLSRLPVALVVADRPATVNGESVDAGHALVRELKRRDTFEWHETDARAARDGVESGRYYMSLTVPANFSANVTSPSDRSGPPRAAALQVHLNDANSYIASTLASAAFREIATAAGTDAVNRYFDNIFVSFGRLHDRLEEAAKGADDLAKGIDRAKSGAAGLREGIGRARAGTDRLAGGLGTAKSGADHLVAGLARLDSGAARLRSGANRVAGGTRRLAIRFDQVSGGLPPLLHHPQNIRNTALLVARGAGDVAAALDALPGQTAQTVQDARAARDRICAVPGQPGACRAADRVAAAAERIDARVGAHAADLRGVAGRSRALARDARRLAADAPVLAGRIERARRDVGRLNAGAQRFATGLGALHEGIGTAYQGQARLANGLGELRDGAVRLQAGLGRLYSGARRLEAGLGRASTGAHKLAGGLHGGARQVPDWDPDERGRRAGVMSEPVRLASSTSNRVPDYGTGFAPFFVPLALWVGAMFAYMVLRPLNPRALAAAAPAWRTAAAGLAPGVVIGVAQVLVLLGTLWFALGLDAVRWLGAIAFLLLGTVTFMAMVQFLYALFGPVGRLVALVLLMLQLTSSAGTYPIETSPAFFRSLEPVLPMGWMVTALRHLVSGGPLTDVWQACAVLTGYLLVAVTLTTLTARRRRLWTLRRLHPVLKL